MVWADKIVIVDSGSADGTLTVARRFTDAAHIFIRDFDDYASQKNFALEQASGDWILSLDADEVVTKELRDEIFSVTRAGGRDAAYRIGRRSRIFGRWFKATGTQDDRPVRLFKNGTARFEGTIHETVRIAGTIGSLKNKILHYTYDTFSAYMKRFNRYTSMEALRFQAEKLPVKEKDLRLKPLVVFFKLYVLKWGFIDGIEGFFFSTLSAYYAFAKHGKHQELLLKAR